MRIFVNGRFCCHRISGVQRYAHEITRRLELNLCEPREALRGWKGHLWEQTVLPFTAGRGVLWSPCAAGPLYMPRHVVTIHDLFAIDSPEWFHPTFSVAYGIILRILARTAIRLIAVSEYTKSRMVSCFGINPAKVSVIHNGVDDRFHQVSAHDVIRAKRTLHLPPVRYLLSVGSIEPRKNLANLLAAWKLVLPELDTDLWLVIAGGGDETVFRNAGIYSSPGRVHFTGYVPDEQLPGLYKGSLGFVYPSLAEGFGLPPLEAMAAGSPVLTSSVTSLPEVCSTAAVYSDPTNVWDLAAGIERIASDSDLRDKLSILGRERALLFTWEKAAAKTMAVLNSVAHRETS